MTLQKNNVLMLSMSVIVGLLFIAFDYFDDFLVGFNQYGEPFFSSEIQDAAEDDGLPTIFAMYRGLGMLLCLRLIKKIRYNFLFLLNFLFDALMVFCISTTSSPTDTFYYSTWFKMWFVFWIVSAVVAFVLIFNPNTKKPPVEREHPFVGRILIAVVCGYFVVSFALAMM